MIEVETTGPGVILLSGGMDSTTLLYLLHKRSQVAKILSFRYGQRHNKELEFAQWHVKYLGYEARYEIISIPKLQGASALVDDSIPVPEGHYEDETMKKTVVPFRNGVMLALAINRAEALGVQNVYYAAHAGDHAIYPDCRPEFMHSMNQAATLGTYNHVKVVGPFRNISKRQIALIGQELGIDWTKTWSCYKGGEVHCGKCGTCVERKEALFGFDPTQYEEDV